MLSRIGLNFACLCAVVLLVSGCGSGNVASVTGVVTLDGQPVDGASVAFYPAEGRASMGLTDAEGKYQLIYSQDANGAEIGEHKVTISTAIDAEVEYGDSDYKNDDTGAIAKVEVVSKARKETMPAKYRDRNKTELRATVKGGANSIDFALTSD